jgi:hypothetical protein
MLEKKESKLTAEVVVSSPSFNRIAVAIENRRKPQIQRNPKTVLHNADTRHPVTPSLHRFVVPLSTSDWNNSIDHERTDAAVDEVIQTSANRAGYVAPRSYGGHESRELAHASLVNCSVHS